MIIMLIFLVITITSNVQAATLHGKIYGPDLTVLKNAVVQLDTVPKQNMVSSDGTYSFTIPPGNYALEAFYTSNGILLYDKEKVNLTNDGDFVVDIILFETTDLENITLDEKELNMIENLLEGKQRTNTWLITGIIAAVIIIAAVSYLIYKSRRKKKPTKRKQRRKFRTKEIKAEEKPIGDEVMSKTLSILKREKRVVQKDIRKELGVSEAKASLVIAELEAQGKVQKIKRGRGNIIIYKD
jgi:uncharacterized membrane protein